jgi:hypothetical protein
MLLTSTFPSMVSGATVTVALISRSTRTFEDISKFGVFGLSGFVQAIVFCLKCVLWKLIGSSLGGRRCVLCVLEDSVVWVSFY